MGSSGMRAAPIAPILKGRRCSTAFNRGRLLELPVHRKLLDSEGKVHAAGGGAEPRAPDDGAIQLVAIMPHGLVLPKGLRHEDSQRLATARDMRPRAHADARPTGARGLGLVHNGEDGQGGVSHGPTSLERALVLGSARPGNGFAAILLPGLPRGATWHMGRVLGATVHYAHLVDAITTTATMLLCTTIQASSSVVALPHIRGMDATRPKCWGSRAKCVNILRGER